MRYDQIVRSKQGTKRHIVKVSEVDIPDLWHVAEKIRDAASGEGIRLTPEDAEEVIETWALCHDLLEHIKRVCREPNSEK
jgi:hypothetical protein